jgi:hypothetical protein
MKDALLPELKTFQNPLRQFIYDNHLTLLQACKLLEISTAQLPVLLNEDPQMLKFTRMLTLKRIKDVTQVDLISWYLNSEPS